jgi:ATP phosphoribosyltransferase regulatory subunit HisZ
VQKVKPALLRGFDQEYLPGEQLQFNRLVEVIRRNFELYGFLPIETPSAERREVLTSKGGVEKEIYALTRLAEADDDEAATKGALRFDLTVPLARYVAMRERELAFPFRRYQIQRVWRGETPQARKGRFREFYQCDIDIINREKLSYLAEAEIPSVIYSVFREMAIGEFRIRINNRKVLRGLLRQFDVPEEKSAEVLRALDKVEKEEAAKIQEELERAGLANAAAAQLYRLIAGKRDTRETLAVLKDFPECAQGLEELRNIVAAIRQFGVPDSAFAVDLGVVRGLDYYTGHHLRDDARQRARARQHLLGRTLRRPRQLFHRHPAARRRHLDRADAPVLEAARGGPAAAARAHPGRGHRGYHGRPLPLEVPRDRDPAARGGRQHRGVPRAGEAQEPARLRGSQGIPRGSDRGRERICRGQGADQESHHPGSHRAPDGRRCPRGEGGIERLNTEGMTHGARS